MLRIVTDTASDITIDQAKDMNIEVVSLDITFEDGPAPQRTEAIPRSLRCRTRNRLWTTRMSCIMCITRQSLSEL